MPYRKICLWSFSISSCPCPSKGTWTFQLSFLGVNCAECRTHYTIYKCVKTIWGVSFVLSGLMCLYYLFWFTFGKRRKGLLACRQKKKKVRKEGGRKEPIPSWFSEFEESRVERQKIKWASGMLQDPEDTVSSRGMKRIVRSVAVSNKLDLCWHPWKNSSEDLDAVLFLGLDTDTGLWTDPSYILVADVILSGMETFVFNEY